MSTIGCKKLTRNEFLLLSLWQETVIPTTQEESLSRQIGQLDRDPSPLRRGFGMTIKKTLNELYNNIFYLKLLKVSIILDKLSVV